MRVFHGADDDVGTAAYVGSDGRFRAHVLPAFGVDADLDARHLRELLGVRGPYVFIALNETLPAQDAQLGAFFWRGLVLRDGLARHQQGPRSERGAGGDAGGGLEKIATLEIFHLPLLQLTTCES